MPYYKNGREAKVGDIVVGTTYNRKGQQIGIIVGITPHTDICNCRVATDFNAIPISFDICALFPEIAQNYSGRNGYDYSEVRILLHIEDYIESLKTIHVTEEGQVPVL